MRMPTEKRTLAAQSPESGPLPVMPTDLIAQLGKVPMHASQVRTLSWSFKKAVLGLVMNATAAAARRS